MGHRSCALRLVICALLGYAAATAEEYQPLPLPVHGPCGVVCKAELPESNARLMSGAYRARGHHDPAWDGPALALLTAYEAYFSSGHMAQRAEDLRDLGERALAAGCHDVWVLYLTARSWGAVNGHAQALALYRRAWQGLDTAPHDPGLRAYVGYHLTQELVALNHGTTEGMPHALSVELNGVFNRAQVAARHMADSKELGKLPEVCWIQFADLFSDHDGVHRQFIAGIVDAVVADPACDPWLKLMVQGDDEIGQAWHARGGGYADTVGDAAAQGFHDHLALARKLLTEAQRLRPDLPYAATLMITVAMGDDEDDTRRWFDRAVAADFTCTEAYSSYEWSLMPRWGGSHEAMMVFARECLATGRYDTGVPLRYLFVVQSIINNDAGKDPDLWRADPRVAGELDRLLAGMCAAKNADPETLPWYTAERVVAAVACGAKARAVSLAKSLPAGGIPAGVWGVFYLDPARGRAQLDGWVSEHDALP